MSGVNCPGFKCPESNVLESNVGQPLWSALHSAVEFSGCPLSIWDWLKKLRNRLEIVEGIGLSLVSPMTPPCSNHSSKSLIVSLKRARGSVAHAQMNDIKILYIVHCTDLDSELFMCVFPCNKLKM